MSNNQFPVINCPVDKEWTRIAEAMHKSEQTRTAVHEMKSKVEKLDKLPEISSAMSEIATAVKSLNRNNTILLIILGGILIIKEVVSSGHNFKASGFGTSVEVQREGR